MAKILVVDDEEDIRTATKKFLESKGYQVVTAENADQALVVAKKEKPDLILMDILMPGTPMQDVLPKLKSYKVIIFSVVRLDEQDVAESGRSIPTKQRFPNVVDHVEKPVNTKDLLMRIRRALDGDNTDS
jgi:CheY-like chemotaxis protein